MIINITTLSIVAKEEKAEEKVEEKKEEKKEEEVSGFITNHLDLEIAFWFVLKLSMQHKCF